VTASKYSAGWHMVISTYEKEEAGITNYYSKATVKENTGNTISTEQLKAIDIIKALELNTQLTAENGQNLVAARTWGTTTTSVNPTTHVATDLGTHVAEANGSGDGTNAVDLSTLFNMNQENTVIDFIAKQFTGNQQTGIDRRSLGTISLEAYYNQRMTALGSDAETMDSKVTAQNEVLVQVNEWRESVSGVNWNEELTNMIMFQQGYSACSRCLTTMDEMLDKLINSTGTVGR
jgi:flagellar hook-associated protein 1 FlgK